ncbi:MAG: ABC transporter ATP-binding protein [Rhodospirillaceae bacterium]
MLLDLRDMACQRGEGESGFRLEVPALSLRAGEAVAITGPSGCGKSTLLDVIGLVLQPTALGAFRFNGQDVGSLWAGRQRDRLAGSRASGIGYILQTGGLLPFITVRENLRLSRTLLNLRHDEAAERRLVEVLGIGRLLDKMPSALSIGERQRVAIGRALSHRPPLILADEPTASLDPAHSDAVMALMLALVADLGQTVVVVSHDWELVTRFGLRRIEAQVSAGPGGTVTRFAA